MIPVDEHTIQRRNIRRAIFYLLIATISATIGVLFIVYDFQELVLAERIKVRPGLPPYELWAKPSADIDVGFRVIIFAVENPDEFLSNTSAKLKLKEIGPIIYKKILHQEEIKFHDENSTLSYSTVFDIVFDEERTEPGILNQTITIINPMLLGLSALVHDVFLARMVFNLMAKNDHVFLKRTVYEALWDNSSPIFDVVKKIPFAAPRNNAGIMYNAVYPTDNRYNVNIGPKHGYKNFFQINTLNGLPRINNFKENFPQHCPYSLKGATEGGGLPPHIQKDDVIYAYIVNLCRTYPMVYNSTMTVDGIKAYKYVFADEIFTRLEDPDLDCFKQTGNVMLPSGLSDASKCAFGLPVAVSSPHFWGYHGDWENYLGGLKPKLDRHSSYIIIEPISGIQLEGIARLQSNIILPHLDYLSFSRDIRRFSGMILPQFWMEYFMVNKDPMIRGLIVVFLSLPVIQCILVILVLLLSVYAFYKSVKLTINLTRTSKSYKEKGIIFEQQLLCPKPGQF